MKNKFFSLLIPFAVIAALVFAACDTGGTNIITKKTCRITFNTAGAATATPDPITVSRGGTMGDQYPSDPESGIDTILFYGWYDSGIQYDAASVINSDLDLVARWVREIDTVTVTFNADGGSAVPDMKVVKGESIGPRLPVSRKKNYTFDGWFSEATKYTALTPVVNADVELTAHWTLKTTHTVSFKTNDVNLLSGGDDDLDTIDPIQVYDGEGLEDQLPTATHTNSKIKFVRWIGADNELYDEFTPIIADITFYAKWGLEPYYVDLSETELVNGDSYNLPDDPPPIRIATPVYDVYNETTKSGTGSIMNSVMYDGAKNRWLILYRIGLNLPGDFNMGYYARYTVRAKFYGNNRAIKTDPLYSVGYMNDDDAITAVGQEMPPKAGYGQISWCVTATSNGNPGQDHQGVIAQQYNLGTTTINNQWLVGGSYEGSKENAIRPNYLLIQTSDNWIGWIEITEIIFHNGEDEFVPPPVEKE